MSSGRISSWTRFKLSSSESLDPTIFKPLIVGNNNCVHDAYYGPIAEFNGEYILVVIWESRQHYEEFKDSAQYRELLSNLKADSSTNSVTQIVDFDKIAFWWRFGPNTELRTVYFPTSLPAESREAVKRLRGLVLTMGLGIDGSRAHLSPYRGVPTCGWTEGSKIWMNQDTISCVWCHYWKDREAERRFKTTETRLPKDMEEDQILASEAFEADLKSFGALGWEDVHVNFKKGGSICPDLYKLTFVELKDPIFGVGNEAYCPRDHLRGPAPTIYNSPLVLRPMAARDVFELLI